MKTGDIEVVELEVDETITLTGSEIEIDGEKQGRQHNRRATDSELSAALADAVPYLQRAQFRRAIRILEEYYEEALDVTSPESPQRILFEMHQITGERRRESK